MTAIARLGATACAAALAAAGLVAAPAAASDMTVAHGYPPQHKVVADGVVPWMECVTEATGGGLNFNHFPSAQLVAHKAAIDSLNAGLTHLSAVIVGYSSEKLPLNTMALLPGLGVDAVPMTAAYRRLLDDQDGPFFKEWEAAGVRPLLISLLPAYQLMSVGAPLDTMEKLKGRKIRAGAGTQTLLAGALGAIPVDMPTSDMYVAVQRGTLDATFLSLASAKAYGMPELIRSTSSNGSFGSGSGVLSISLDAWNGLSAEEQAAMDACGRKVEDSLARLSDEANTALKTEFAAAGIDVYAFPPETLARFDPLLKQVAADYVARLNQRGLDATAAFEKLQAAFGAAQN